jgi:hypothetical protein
MGNFPALREIPGTIASILEVNRTDSTLSDQHRLAPSLPYVSYAVP